MSYIVKKVRRSEKTRSGLWNRHTLRAKGNWSSLRRYAENSALSREPICFVEREHEVLFQPVTKEHIRNLAGMLKGTSSATGELLKQRKLDKEREDKKFARRRAR
jgi:hypothetical protein